MHHAGHAKRGKPRQLDAIPGLDIRRAPCVCVADTGLNGFKRITPHAVNELVLPVVRTLRDHLESIVYENGLDSRRTEFDAKNRLVCSYKVLDVHHPLPVSGLLPVHGLPLLYHNEARKTNRHGIWSIEPTVEDCEQGEVVREPVVWYYAGSASVGAADKHIVQRTVAVAFGRMGAATRLG